VTAPTLIALGRRLRPLERVETAGSLLGLSRSTSYRLARSWPLVGPESSRWVLVVPWLLQHGIPYEVAQESSSDPHRRIDSAASVADDSGSHYADR
jgi:hypothetical protein